MSGRISLEVFKEDFKNYPQFYELLKILNKEKVIHLPYSISYTGPYVSIKIDIEKNIVKYPVEEADQIIDGNALINIIDNMLDIIGFKKIIKDYVIVAISSFHSKDTSNTLFYYFNVLFDKPELNNYEKNEELFHPQFFNTTNFVDNKDFYKLKQFIDVYMCYILTELPRDTLKKKLGLFFNLNEEYRMLIKDIIFNEIKNTYVDSNNASNVSFEKYYSNEELLQELDKFSFFEQRLKGRNSFFWYETSWSNLGGMRFVFEKEYKKVDIKVKGFGTCSHLFEN